MIDVNAELQRAQDMIEGIRNQREAAQNECVQLAAQLKAALRKVQELENKLQEKTEQPELPLPLSNGRDEGAEARPN